MVKRASILISLLALVFAPSIGGAADFSVSPIRLFFEPGQRTGVLQINNSSDTRLDVQLAVFDWKQDAEGKDVYTPTKDIVLFPKLLSIEKGESRIIRVGITKASGHVEKTYRVYVEELPTGPAPTGGATVRTLLKIGVPIFIEPVGKLLPSGVIEDAALAKGTLKFTVKNTGNVNFILNKTEVTGTDRSGNAAYKDEISGWYVLSGDSRQYSLKVPQKYCPTLKSIDINIVNDHNVSLKKRLDVSSEMCSQ